MMKNYKINHLLYLAIFLFSSMALKAQDPHFSQINSAPVHMNPALIGVFEGQFRVNVNYRDQWRAVFEDVPYKTTAASLDMRFYALKNDYVAFSVGVMGDRAGTSNFSQTQSHVGLSYMKQLVGGRGRNDVQYLIAGAQLGMGQNGINWHTLRWSTQFDGEAFNASLPSGETFGEQSNVYTDINAGLMWYGLFGKNRSVYAGGAMHHINEPDIAFLENQSEPLYRRYTIHAGGEYPISRDVILLPAVRALRQGPSMEINFGSSVRFTSHDFRDVALRMGLFGSIVNRETTVSSDALTFITALEWDRWTLGMSYDITISGLREANEGRGAFEISMVYTHPAARRGGIYCPTF